MTPALSRATRPEVSATSVPVLLDPDAAVRHLRAVCPRMARLMDAVGAINLRNVRDPFAALAYSIIHQQLAMKAAATIRKRVVALCPRRRISPQALAAVSDEALLGAGLSRQKLGYLRDLSAHFADGRLTSRRLRRLSDEDVITSVTAVKGIGRWTAEMLLTFCLRRPDVWPVDDLGLRKAAQRFVGARKPLSRDRLAALGDRWRPFRTVATWYLWRSLENPVLPGIDTSA